MSDGVVITEDRKLTPDGCNYRSPWEGTLKFDKSGGSQYPDDVEFQLHKDGCLEITCDNGHDAIASFMCGPDEIERLALFVNDTRKPFGWVLYQVKVKHPVTSVFFVSRSAVDAAVEQAAKGGLELKAIPVYA